MTGHDGARGLIVGTDLPLFVSCFCIFAHTFASQMRPGGKQQHSYGDGTFPKSSAQLLEDSHHHRQGETIKKAERFKTEDMIARLFWEKMQELKKCLLHPEKLPHQIASNHVLPQHIINPLIHHLKGSLCRNGGPQTFDHVGLFAASEPS